MFKDIWQEIGELTQDRQFARNTSLVVMMSLLSSCSFALAGTSSGRLAQQEKLERFSHLMTVGICIRTQIVLRQ